jgi:hypothetical protein
VKKTDKSVDQDIWNHPDRLRKWTIEQLQRLESDAYPHPLPSLLDTPGDPRLTWDARYLAGERAADEQIRNELRRVKKNRPEDYGSILSHNPELEGYLQSVRGRPKGHQAGLEQAWAEIARIRQLWQQAFGRSYIKGAGFPLAYEIAAERWDVTPEEIDNYRKNRSRVSD